ncbi:MAG TPA: alpha/beta hydrolase [Candidatus Acidoferrales bacterium]|nr:alpha/beta hydrolase [Candidatus Acidoferrales bacterium]
MRPTVKRPLFRRRVTVRFLKIFSPFSPSGWDIPTAAQTLVVLVHGYDVGDSEAQTKFFPTYFKRLYWAGHDVLLAQNNTHTVGLAWPGDIDAPLEFAPDEFSALQSGVPLAKWLSDQSLAYNRKIQIIAHSLGNMVVNSALSRPEIQGAAITTYLMNEAAVPAEAFYSTYPSDQAFDQHALDYGWSDTGQPPVDKQWQDQWDQINQGIPLTGCDNGNLCPTYDYLNQWNATLSAPSYVTSPAPQYFLRWNQERSGGVPDNELLDSLAPCA